MANSQTPANITVVVSINRIILATRLKVWTLKAEDRRAKPHGCFEAKLETLSMGPP